MSVEVSRGFPDWLCKHPIFHPKPRLYREWEPR